MNDCKDTLTDGQKAIAYLLGILVIGLVIWGMAAGTRERSAKAANEWTPADARRANELTEDYGHALRTDAPPSRIRDLEFQLRLLREKKIRAQGR